MDSVAHLEIHTRDSTHRVELHRDRLSIGRLSYNDIVLPYPQISRQHAELRLVGSDWWVADLNSTNGVQINSSRVQEHVLAHGDMVTLAPGITLTFMMESPPPDASSVSQPYRADWVEEPWHNFAQPSTDSPAASREGMRKFAATFGTREPAVSGRPPSSPSNSWHPPSPPPTGQTAPSHPRVPDVAPQRPATGPRDIPGRRAGFVRPNVPFDRTPATGIPAAGTPHEAMVREIRRPTMGPAPSLLHVCQTCGQLTTPDTAQCQNCQNPIGEACRVCGLTLLPIQNQCPRCQTPNPHSVRRAHQHRSG